MKFFIDTANLDQIAQAQAMGILDGVTTNPSLMAKEGITGHDNILEHYRKICRLVPGGAISAEVLATDYSHMVSEGRELAGLDPQIVVKVPITEDGLRAIKTFHDEGIQTNCTLVFSAAQALLAAKAGASYVSPFLGRLDDIDSDGLELIRQIRQIFDNYAIETRILAASIRHVKHITGCALLGADVVTAPLSAIKGMLVHPLTENGLKKFVEDAAKMTK